MESLEWGVGESCTVPMNAHFLMLPLVAISLGPYHNVTQTRPISRSAKGGEVRVTSPSDLVVTPVVAKQPPHTVGGGETTEHG